LSAEDVRKNKSTRQTVRKKNNNPERETRTNDKRSFAEMQHPATSLVSLYDFYILHFSTFILLVAAEQRRTTAAAKKTKKKKTKKKKDVNGLATAPETQGCGALVLPLRGGGSRGQRWHIF